MYGALDVSTSGLVAQRTWLDVISGNLANARTLIDSDGTYAPYRRRFLVLEAEDAVRSTGAPGGVRVASIELDDAPLVPRYEPGSPFADADGYVNYPNVDPVIEQMNAMIAQRAYEANIAAVEATKSMMSVALQMLA